MLEVGQEWSLYTTPFKLKETTTPTAATVPGNTLALYAKDRSGVSALYYFDDAGVEHDLSGGLTGTGTAGRLAKWSSSTVLADFVPTAGSVLFAGASGIGQEDNANLFWDDTNNFLGLGNAIPTSRIHMAGSTDVLSALTVERDSSDTSNPTIGGQKARNTFASPAAVNNLDRLLRLVGNGYTGAAFATGAFLEIVADETFSGTAHGSHLSLYTTAKTTTTLSERFRVGDFGGWGIGGATYGTSGQVFTSGGSAAAPTWTSPISGSPSALTKVDDTNVTLTLGGTPSTALLQATSLTLGWTGTLALSRLAQGTDGQLIVGQTSASPLYKTLSGDATLSAAGALTLASILTAGGPTGSSTVIPVITWDAKGRLTAVSTATPATQTSTLLDGTVHTDTTAGTVARGDVVTGQGASAKWVRLGIGGANTVLTSNGTDVAWAAGGGGSFNYGLHIAVPQIAFIL